MSVCVWSSMSVCVWSSTSVCGNTISCPSPYHKTTAALQPKPPLAAPKPLPPHAVPPSTTPHPLPRPTSPPPCSPILLCCDFDKTITDCDAGERLVGELAPELLPMLTGIEMPANFIPMTNSVLAEMHRRGMGRDALLHALRGMGGEVPAASRAMLRWAAARDVDIRVLSDCNSVFIAHVLAAAKVAPYVREVCTNPATFHRVSLAVDDKGLYGGGVDNQTGNTQTGTTGIPSPHAHDDNENGVTSEKGIPSDKGIQNQPPPSAGVHRLVIAPLHPSHLPPHGCPLCPANLCKGAELRRLREESVAVGLPYKRIVYCGDGANDLCPALALGEQDVLLARRCVLCVCYVCGGGGGGGRIHMALYVVLHFVARYVEHLFCCTRFLPHHHISSLPHHHISSLPHHHIPPYHTVGIHWPTWSSNTWVTTRSMVNAWPPNLHCGAIMWN